MSPVSKCVLTARKKQTVCEKAQVNCKKKKQNQIDWKLFKFLTNAVNMKSNYN